MFVASRPLGRAGLGVARQYSLSRTLIRRYAEGATSIAAEVQSSLEKDLLTTRDLLQTLSKSKAGSSSNSGSKDDGLISELSAIVARVKKARKKKSSKVEGGVGTNGPKPTTQAFVSVPSKPDSTSMAGFTTGWGEDKLAPKETLPTSPATKKKRSRKSSKKARGKLSGSQGSGDIASIPPSQVDRRIQLLIDRTEQVLEDVKPFSEESETTPVPQLAHGLERVLFNPSVHWLQDPRSQVYNYSPILQKLPSVSDFAFERLGEYVTSSKDNALRSLASREGKKFAGSTSSLGGLLTHIYLLISGDKPVDLSVLSSHFSKEKNTFTNGMRLPGSIIMDLKDGVYSVDAVKINEANSNILLWLGTMLEKFLTYPEDEFNKLLKSNEAYKNAIIETRAEAYRYSKSSKFMMRAQLDARDPRLPGTGVFDIKTRAAVAIRLDSLNYIENSGYLIKYNTGALESFEREYYDLIRSAFLKYSFQARIGAMDGIFVAYHNTERMFGFQYVSLDEMDNRVFGGPKAARKAFAKCVAVMEELAEEVTQCFPGESVRCTFATVKDTMSVWVEPETWDESVRGVRPIAKLEVTAVSRLGDKVVQGPVSFEQPAEWNLHITISRISRPEHHPQLQKELQAARAQELKLEAFLPEGVSQEEMVARLAATSYDGKPPVAPNGNRKFVKAPKMIETLRELSRQGRKHTESLRNDGSPSPTTVNSTTEEHDVDLELLLKEPVAQSTNEKPATVEGPDSPYTPSSVNSSEPCLEPPGHNSPLSQSTCKRPDAQGQEPSVKALSVSAIPSPPTITTEAYAHAQPGQQVS